jgi:hypothetical protein
VHIVFKRKEEEEESCKIIRDTKRDMAWDPGSPRPLLVRSKWLQRSKGSQGLGLQRVWKYYVVGSWVRGVRSYDMLVKEIYCPSCEGMQSYDP